MSSSTLAPIVMFVYKRPRHARRTLAALRQNAMAEESELIIYSDGPKDTEAEPGVKEVRAMLSGIRGFKRVHVIQRDKNLGLARSILSGVSEVVEQYGRVIVMEDDLLTSPWFLRYQNGALEAYRDDPRIFSISGAALPTLWMGVPRDYPHSVWLSKRNQSYGWGTWADRWTAVDWGVSDFASFRADPVAQAAFNEGGGDLSEALIRQQEEQQDLWAVRFTYAHFRQHAWTLAPLRGYVKHIGYDGSGGNTRWNPLRWMDSIRGAPEHPMFPADLEPDPRLLEACRRVYARRIRLEKLARSCFAPFIGPR